MLKNFTLSIEPQYLVLNKVLSKNLLHDNDKKIKIGPEEAISRVAPSPNLPRPRSHSPFIILRIKI